MQRVFAVIPWYIAIFAILLWSSAISYVSFTVGFEKGSLADTLIVPHETIPTEEDTAEISPYSSEWLTYYNHELGFYIEYPKTYKFEENPDGEALVAFYDPQWRESGVPATKMYQAYIADTPSFEAFTTEITTHYLQSLIDRHNETRAEGEEPADLSMYEGRYTFEEKVVQGTPVLVHSRDFLSESDTITETYIWRGNGEYLVIVGTGVNLNTLYIEPEHI